MRIIQTYCTFEGEPSRMNAGFTTLRMFIAWFKKSYAVHSKFDYLLYTDKQGYDNIKDIVKPHHVRVINFPLINDYIPYIGKFHVQSIQNKPYVHVDLDALLYEPPYSSKEDVISEMWRPVGFGREIEQLGMEEYVYKKQGASLTKIFDKIICSGLLGFNDMELQKHYISEVLKKIEHIRKYKIYPSFEVCYTIEETLLTSIVLKQGKTVKALCPCAYTHLQGRYKIY